MQSPSERPRTGVSTEAELWLRANPPAGRITIDDQNAELVRAAVREGWEPSMAAARAEFAVRENVLEIHGVDKAERRRRSNDWLTRCKIADFADHYPHQLSGGMRQRAALARTLATDPHVLLLDEPFSALDAQTKMILQQDLAQTLSEAGKTALFITHDLVEAVALSDRVLVMSQRPGKIIEEIVVDIPGRDNPMERRKDPKIGEYVAQLMSLLHVGDVELEAI